MPAIRYAIEKGDAMPICELGAGPIEYGETPGDGPCLVLLHGLLMNASVWDDVVARLPAQFRVIRPTWPLGAHRLPMRPDADLSLVGHARLVAEFLAALDVRDVTLVFSDWSAAQVLIGEDLHDRVGRLVLVSCETDDNYPPGLPGRTAAFAARVPGGVNIALQSMRVRAVRRLPLTFGWMSKRPIPHEKMDAWFAPGQSDAAVRRDLARYAADTRNGRRALEEAAPALHSFTKPVLVVWALEDRVMPVASGRRLAAAFPNAEFISVRDSRNLVALDQPETLADLLGDFADGRRGPLTDRERRS